MAVLFSVTFYTSFKLPYSQPAYHCNSILPAIMKKIILLIALLPLLTVGAGLKPAPTALQEFTKKMSASKNFSLRFAYIVQNGGSIETQASGALAVSGVKYRLDTDGSLVVFDGSARYTYVKAADEIVIETPNPLRDGIFADPSAIFAINYNDFNIAEQTQNGSGVTFDLTPKQEGLPYQKITLGLDKSYLPSKIIYYGADGRTTALTINDFKTQAKPAANFTFDTKAYPQAEVVDMR
jgi:outer membrane lipoprotein-sorting protein